MILNQNDWDSPPSLLTIKRVEDALEENYILNNFIPEHTLGAILGPAKIGKIALSLHLLFCVQNSLPFLGHKTINSGDALFVNIYGPSEHIIYEILTKIRKLYGLSESECTMPYILNVTDSNTRLTQILDMCRERPELKLVVFNDLHSMIKDTSDETEVQKVLSWLKDVSKEISGSVFYIHHSNRTGCTDIADDVIYSCGCGDAHKREPSSIITISPSRSYRGAFCINMQHADRFVNHYCIKNNSTGHLFVPATAEELERSASHESNI